jgi:hypothetical protein
VFSPALIVMEDLSERAQIGELAEGASVEAVRDLLRVLAQVHALSMQRSGWAGLLQEHPPFFFAQTAKFLSSVVRQWNLFDAAKLEASFIDVEE